MSTRRTKAEMAAIRESVVQVTNKLRGYWPLTLRQIYYQLVASGRIENKRSDYKMLSKVTTQMRNNYKLSWAVMEDRTRRAVEKRRWTDKAEFVRQQLGDFLEGYSRCLVQQQENYVELWTEKDALSRIFERVGIPYCVTVVTCKGHLSTTFLKNYADRAEAAIMRGQRPVIIYGGDLDPSGWRIPVSIEERLICNHHLSVEIHRFAVNPDQVQKYDLPNNPDALKWSDPNAIRYVRQFGRIAVELDALHPSDLENEIESALALYLDMDGLDSEKHIQRKERDDLEDLRKQVIVAIEDMGIEF